MFRHHLFTSVTCVTLTSILLNYSSQRSDQNATRESYVCVTGQFQTDNRAVFILDEKITGLCGQRSGLIVRVLLREPCVTLALMPSECNLSICSPLCKIEFHTSERTKDKHLSFISHFFLSLHLLAFSFTSYSLQFSISIIVSFVFRVCFIFHCVCRRHCLY